MTNQTEPAAPDVQFTKGPWRFAMDDMQIMAGDNTVIAEIVADDPSDPFAIANGLLLLQAPAMFEALERALPALKYSAEAFEVWGNFSAEADLKRHADSIATILQAVKMGSEGSV